MDLQPESLLALSPQLRYAATYLDGVLRTAQRAGLPQASSAESDRYEELLVNPTLLTLVTRRGNIDCGGARCVLVRYGHFTQLVVPLANGHLSVAISPEADAPRVAELVLASLRG